MQIQPCDNVGISIRKYADKISKNNKGSANEFFIYSFSSNITIFYQFGYFMRLKDMGGKGGGEEEGEEAYGYSDMVNKNG